MPRYLLRAEAVNFDWSCYDTQDLSTIRGGSMLMMDAHRLIKLPSGVQLEVHGASQAIWSFEAADKAAAEDVRRSVETALTEDIRLRHTTFVVDVIPESDNGEADLHELRARNRWRQLQQPTLAVPEPHAQEEGGKKSYCEFDRVRPGKKDIPKGDESFRVSPSVKARRDYGIEQKREFYVRTVPGIKSLNLEFANELEDITSRADLGKDDLLKHLDGKMAVIYCDGNKQGEMTAKLNRKELAEFRDYTRNRQGEFLDDLLKRIAASRPEEPVSNDWFYYDPAHGGRHLARLETLVWGGDDILLVVPAWQGWDVIRLFFAHVIGTGGGNPWRFPPEPDGSPFTYTAGLVFCNKKASIHQMRDLAEDLFIEGKKKASREKHDEEGEEDASLERHDNWLGYEVMESYDIVGDDIARWRDSRLSSEEKDGRTLLLKPDHLEQVANLVRAVRELVDDPDSDVSRRQIERYARTMRKRPKGDVKFDGEVEGYLRNTGFDNDMLSDLDTRQKLHHLAALWDYIP